MFENNDPRQYYNSVAGPQQDNTMVLANNNNNNNNPASNSPHGSSPQNGGNEHNINVVIRVRPIITPPRASSLNKSIIQTTTTTTANNELLPLDQRHGRQQQQQHDEIDADQSTAITFPAAGQIQVQDTIANVSRSFAFNVVFEPEATQEEVFEHSGVKRLIDMALDGFACTVFAYGQTSTGKTYTLTGNTFQLAKDNVNGQSGSTSSSSSTSKNNHHHHNWRNGRKQNQSFGGSTSIDHQFDEDENNNNVDKPPPPLQMKNIGIVQLLFAYLFEQIKRKKQRDKTQHYLITVSYLEVYNEQVLDLLNPSPRSLNVRWAKDRGFYAENLFKVECEDLGDLEGVLEEGCKNRQVRSHSMNENSSRSHSVMTITLHSEMSDPEDPQGFIHKEGRLCLVDLAGSEKTKRTNSKGGTFVEANNINRSLLVLGNCIACLADPKRRNGHIPYRDSTLTKLLADSLSGNGMTLMIACVSPAKCDAQETISTLRYASRAKRVRMNPVVQMDPRELLILSLKREVRLLKMENNYLRQNYHQIWSNNNGGISHGVNPPLQQQDSLGKSSIVNGKSGGRDSNHDNMGLLDKYMKENEILRVENVQVNLQRNRLVRDHELVCRENERLLRKLNMLLGNKMNPTNDPKVRSILANTHPSNSHTSEGGSGLFSSASSPSILSLAYDDDDQYHTRTTPVANNINSASHITGQNQISSMSTMFADESLGPSDDNNDLILIRNVGDGDPNRKPTNSGSSTNSGNKSNQKSSSQVTTSMNNHGIHYAQQDTGLDLTIRGKSAAVNGGAVNSHKSVRTTRRN